MAATLEYKGYVARVEVDEENDTLHGRVINITDVVNFKGGTISDLKREFANSMKEYFEFCKERGVEPEKPFSGKFVLRVSPEVHRAITIAAAREGTSLNKWATEKLELAAAE